MKAFRHIRIVLLGLLVALLQLGVPVLAYAKMAKSNGLVQEICTPSGMKKVMVDANGVAAEVAADAHHDDHCQLCSTAGPTPVATLISLHESARSPGLIRVGQTCFQSGSAVSTPPATGPPSGS
jgi:hypothetical protein